MERKTMIIATVLVAILAVAAIGGYLLLRDGESSASEADMKFMIEDGEGVYFWIEGDGDTALAAFEDACKHFNVPYVLENNGIKSLFGIESDSGNAWEHTFWASVGWDQSADVKDLKDMSTSDSDACYIVYTDSYPSSTVTPKSAVVQKNLTGSKFLIQSNTGLYFWVCGEGGTALEALVDACQKFNVPFLPSYSSTWGYGISSIFGLSATPDWSLYWGTVVWNDGNWCESEKGLGNIKTEWIDCYFIEYAGFQAWNPAVTPDGEVYEGTIGIWSSPE